MIQQVQLTADFHSSMQTARACSATSNKANKNQCTSLAAVRVSFTDDHFAILHLSDKTNLVWEIHKEGRVTTSATLTINPNELSHLTLQGRMTDEKNYTHAINFRVPRKVGTFSTLSIAQRPTQITAMLLTRVRSKTI